MTIKYQVLIMDKDNNRIGSIDTDIDDPPLFIRINDVTYEYIFDLQMYVQSKKHS